MPPPSSAPRPFEKLSDDELRSLVAPMAAFPNVLDALFREVCERRFDGWGGVLSGIQAGYAAARTNELNGRLEELTQLKKSAEAAERDRPRAAPVGAPRASWEQTVAQVRSARLVAVQQDGTPNRSPLCILGYDALPALSDPERCAFLYDFVAKAQFTGLLQQQEFADWGAAMTVQRVRHTASQVARMQQLATRLQDIDFLEHSFGRMLSPQDWKDIRAMAAAASPISP